MERVMNGDFSALDLPMPSSQHTPEQARREARERSTEVLSKWNTLRQILERYEDVIRKRWTKKTKVQRAKLILAAWPDMSPKHRPDFEAIFRGGQELQNRRTEFREAFLWPSMNVEDLATGKTMLLLLNSRGRHSPNMFAKADFEATRVGLVSQAILPTFINMHTMLLDGEAIETYGRIVSFDENEDEMLRMFSGLGYHPGEGLWILEIQQKILNFLVKCCHAVLHDFTPSSLIASDTPIKVEPSPIIDSLEYPTLASMAAQAPYRLPALLDFTHLRAFAAAKLSNAEDHVRGLREDPGYFSDVVGDWSEHRLEQVLDANRERHPIIDSPEFWNRVIGNVVGDAYGTLISWDLINGQLANLSVLQAKYASIITTKEKLPSEYMKALLTLRYSLDQISKHSISLLKNGILASPPLRSSSVRDPHVAGSSLIQVRSKMTHDPMMWLFNNLWSDRHLELLTLPNLVDEIENLIQRDPRNKAMISPWVAGVFANLGLIAHIKHELDIYQPWAAGFDRAYVDHSKEIESEYLRRIAKIADVNRNLGEVPFAKFGTPTGGRFRYPSDKRRTEQNTDTMREAELKLDLFWDNVDGVYQRKNGRPLKKMVQYLIKDVRPLERTPEWVEPPKPRKKPAADSADELGTAISDFQIDLPSKFIASQPKVKPKTRGTSNTLNIAPEQAPGPSAEEGSQPVFVLNNRGYKVFQVLFFNPSQNDLPGEVSWADFLFAMAATGFAPEKLYGSIWQFTPSTLDVERSIQFHEPHPVGKIPFRNARRIGRRLNRAYGWRGDMFMLE